jgi:hypothetical protein
MADNDRGHKKPHVMSATRQRGITACLSERDGRRINDSNHWHGRRRTLSATGWEIISPKYSPGLIRVKDTGTA